MARCTGKVSGLWVAVAILFVGSATSLAEEPSFGIYYGDGLRHLAEGDHEAAVEALFRAYGMSQRADVMALIVRAYDEMGHCDAVQRQMVFFDEVHGDDGEEIGIERCAEVGEVTVVCEEGGFVRVERARWVPCGRTLKVPAGETVRFRLGGVGDGESVEVGPGQRREVTLGEATEERANEPSVSPAQIARLSRWTARVDRLAQSGARVPRIGEGGPAYRVYRTSDGLYQVWFRREGQESPARTPRVEIICPEDAPEGEVDEGCSYLRELRDRDGPNQGSTPRRYEVVVPRVP